MAHRTQPTARSAPVSCSTNFHDFFLDLLLPFIFVRCIKQRVQYGYTCSLEHQCNACRERR
jgi:hypothetical protein